jgi:tRNA(Ile2) C34 agmatinyltransferase TiaS
VNARDWFYGPLGFGSSGPMPTGATVRKTDVVMARTEKGLCPFCEGPMNEDGRCDRCREEA